MTFYDVCGRQTWAFSLPCTCCGFACVLSLMETMQSLLKFVPKRDIFICDFIVTMKVYHSSLDTSYCDNKSSFNDDEL
jgi:hypothetical protein